MKFTKRSRFKIAKNKIPKANTILEPLDYESWVKFIDNNQDFFIWKENTEEGKKTLKNINEISEDFRERVLASLNKGACSAEFNTKKDVYNIRVSINNVNNWVTINFARTPKLEDLKIFVEMAENLDAYLLINDKKIITREDIDKEKIV